MEILGRTLSDNAVQFVNEYRPTLTKPLRIVDLPQSHPHWGGFSDNPFEYLIGVKTDMPDIAFEATFCHELYHAYQISVGFPTVIPDQEGGKDIEEFAEYLRSNILDLSADNAVRSYNLNDSLVMKSRYKQIKQLAYSNFAIITDQYRKDRLSMDLLLDLHALTDNQKQPILDALKSTLPDVYAQHVEFQNVVDINGYDTPKGCFNIMGYIIDKIGLWSYCGIEYCGKVVKSSRRFNEYRAIDPTGIHQ